MMQSQLIPFWETLKILKIAEAARESACRFLSKLIYPKLRSHIYQWLDSRIPHQIYASHLHLTKFLLFLYISF